MGFTNKEMASRGFRASASSLLSESGQWPADAIEAELGHVGADEVRRAYHRAAYWDERLRWLNGGRRNWPRPDRRGRHRRLVPMDDEYSLGAIDPDTARQMIAFLATQVR
ncbi:hypothetical protein GCM10011335_01160 [Aureimonas glaciei]|uniref:Integrase n=1 Tax=Aureimonas glaciei TaxID=1776957 RepID=A0A916V1H9_9HYPH|nr:hypothetical protein GCM10011335_01160 [Aureimonas glaciei]